MRGYGYKGIPCSAHLRIQDPRCRQLDTLNYLFGTVIPLYAAAENLPYSQMSVPSQKWFFQMSSSICRHTKVSLEHLLKTRAHINYVLLSQISSEVCKGQMPPPVPPICVKNFGSWKKKTTKGNFAFTPSLKCSPGNTLFVGSPIASWRHYSGWSAAIPIDLGRPARRNRSNNHIGFFELQSCPSGCFSNGMRHLAIKPIKLQSSAKMLLQDYLVSRL